jgi:CO/xanthine dehydrogenase Mo-binding subunit
MTGQETSGVVSRRVLVTGSLASGFLLAFHVPVRAVNEPVQPPNDTAGKFAPNAFIRIDHSGKTTLVMPQVEMGQGTYTSISMILAEELDADFAQVAVEHAPPSDRLYANPAFGIQATGNSNSVRAFWEPLRKAGASARAMLVQAAAQQWQVDPASCTTANGIPGVQKIVILGDLVAVVGDHMWAAKKGLDALQIDWDEGPNARISTNDIWQDLRAASEKEGSVAKSRGDIAKGLATGEKFEAAFEMPFLAHATMEPVNATVHIKPNSCEIWTGTQVLARVQSEAAKAAGLRVEKVIANNHLLGGGFRRKLEPHIVVKAVRIAKHVDGPVKVIWTREEDIQQDIYRPVYRDTIAATLSAGKIVGWKYRISGSSIMARWFPPGFQNGIDIDAVDSAVDMPYEIPNFQVEYVRVEPPAVPTGFWRGVGPNNNVFAIECFMDELARKAGKDPIEFRRSMLGKHPRFLAALDLAAEKSGWGQPLPARVGRGVCLQPSFASFIATVVEAEVDEVGEVNLRRATSVVDTVRGQS